MTAPGALPTREWFAGFLGRFHAKALHNPSAWEEAVDELEARLRPAWEQVEQNYLESITNLSVASQDLITQRDALRADLRACAEALEKAPHHQLCPAAPQQYQSLERRCTCHKAALARPGAQEALK